MMLATSPTPLSVRAASRAYLGWLVALVALVAPLRAAHAGPATDAVKSANESVAELLKKKAKPAVVTAAVRNFLDLDLLGQLALKDHWAKLTDAQKTEYLTLLRRLIEASYLQGVKQNLQFAVTYDGETANADGTIAVATTVNTTRKGRPAAVPIGYVLSNVSGTYKAFDVVTDGVGLVENYRAQFNKIIAKEGFDGLVKRMKKKLETAK